MVIGKNKIDYPVTSHQSPVTSPQSPVPSHQSPINKLLETRQSF
ncbi:hypothetical protein [Sphaerospermopsis aphanizomenoides]|nr:hypothetical protein [Sphaerospermopsis aphanizomenoides]